MLFALATVVVAIADLFDRFVERYAIPHYDHMLSPQRRLIQWGPILVGGDHPAWTARVGTYFFIELPWMRSWEPIDYAREYGWCHAVIYRRQHFDGAPEWGLWWKPVR